MMRLIRIGAAAAVWLGVGALALGGCSTDEICDRACDAWAQNGCWDRDVCMDRCDSEGDWSEAYADCCEDHAGDCASLQSICG